MTASSPHSYIAALQEMVDAHLNLLQLEGFEGRQDSEYASVLTEAERRMKRAVESACELLDAAYEKLR